LIVREVGGRKERRVQSHKVILHHALNPLVGLLQRINEQRPVPFSTERVSFGRPAI